MTPDVCDSPDCIDKSYSCNVTSPTTLKSCTPHYDSKGNEDDDVCYQCYGDMTCQEATSATAPINLTQELCISPYIWGIKAGSTTASCSLPGGFWCQPFNIPKIECNTFTGLKILGKVSEHAPYEWICACSNDTKFTNNGNPLSDCKHIRVCGMDGRTNKDYPLDDRKYPQHLVKKNTHPDNPDYLWNGQWDPFTDGECFCGDESVTGQTSGPNLTCVSNSCFPGTTGGDPSGQCKCEGVNPPLIDCSLVSTRGGFPTGVCTTPSCIPDPCYPGIFDKNLNKGEGGCDCTTGIDGYIATPSLESVSGEICVNWCDTSKNPCGSRGTCQVSKEVGLDERMSFDFQSITDSNNWIISNTSTDLKIPYYIKVDGNGALSVDSAGGSEFQIESKKDTTPITSLITNIKYYLKFGTNYLVIPQGKNSSFTATKTDATPWMYVGDRTNTGNGLKGRFFLDPLSLKILTISSMQILSVGESTVGKPTCKDCRVPYAQSLDNICSQTCLTNGEHPGTSNCCSCNKTCPDGCGILCDDDNSPDKACSTYCSGPGGNQGEISKYSSITGCR